MRSPNKVQDVLELDSLDVYKGRQFAGKLIRQKSGGVSFEYDKEYFNSNADAIAFHFPKSQITFNLGQDNLHPFFAGLLPEGVRLSSLIKVLKTSPSDLFSLLAASGEDLVGDVYVKIENSNEQKITITKSDFSKVNFVELFRESINSNQFAVRNLDSSLPGIQPKISASILSFPIKLAKQKRSYILKLETVDYPQIVKNEYFFMQLARKCGLRVANTEIVYDLNSNPALLVERFDRIYNPNEKLFDRVHVEDACQFMNVYPQDKYRLNLREVSKSIQEFATAPLIEISKLIKLTAYSYIICNGDLHGKNISLMCDLKTRSTTLSPAYDLLTTLPYGDQTMALNFEGRKDNFKAKHFMEFADAFAVPEKVVALILKEVTTVVSSNLQFVGQIGFDKKKTDFLIKTIKKRIVDLAS